MYHITIASSAREGITGVFIVNYFIELFFPFGNGAAKKFFDISTHFHLSFVAISLLLSTPIPRLLFDVPTLMTMMICA